MKKAKLLKYCFYYYSFTVFMSAIYLTAPTITNYNSLEITKEIPQPIKKEKIKSFLAKK